MNTVSVLLKGGLGNMMFQISTAFSISLRDKMYFCVDMSHYHGGHYGVEKYSSNILRNLNFCNSNGVSNMFVESKHEYQEVPKFESDVKFLGYFQTDKYFSEFRDEILDFFSPTEEIVNKLNSKYGEVINKDTCSIHVRRGDYIDLSEFYTNLDEEYYKKSYDIIGHDKTYLIISDDINWCKENFDFVDKKVFVENLEDYESLYLMSLCKNNIIANSTFSWWGAWLNKQKDRKVVSPKNWFGKNLKGVLSSNDIPSDEWIVI